MCQTAQRDGFRDIDCAGIEFVDACPLGKVPRLTPENRRFVETVLERLLPGLGNGTGGFQFQSIDSVLDRLGLPAGKALVLYDRCIVIVRAIQQVRETEREK